MDSNIILETTNNAPPHFSKHPYLCISIYISSMVVFVGHSGPASVVRALLGGVQKSISLSIWLCLSVFIYGSDPPIYLSIYIPIYLPICRIYLSIYLFSLSTLMCLLLFPSSYRSSLATHLSLCLSMYYSSIYDCVSLSLHLVLCTCREHVYIYIYRCICACVHVQCQPLALGRHELLKRPNKCWKSRPNKLQDDFGGPGPQTVD